MNIPQKMRAMVLEEQRKPLVYKDLPVPEPGKGQVLIKVKACGICRTDLHVIDADLKEPRLPLIPGHEIIGHIVQTGGDVSDLQTSDLVGVPWVGYTCGVCKFCKAGKENLCDNAKFTGYTIDGGYAEYTVANARFCFKLDEQYNDAAFSPLLCAGLIGFRSYHMIDPKMKNIGIYGFGASAHIITQVAVAQGKKIFAFTRDGDSKGQEFAKQMGAYWTGGSSEMSPEKLDAAIIFAAVGNLLPKALQDAEKGGEVICGGIHMTDIPSFSYDLLWGERSIKSVANLTRQDGLDFFELLKSIPVKTQTRQFKLEQANEALDMLRKGEIEGAAVLVME